MFAIRKYVGTVIVRSMTPRKNSHMKKQSHEMSRAVTTCYLGSNDQTSIKNVKPLAPYLLRTRHEGFISGGPRNCQRKFGEL